MKVLEVAMSLRHNQKEMRKIGCQDDQEKKVPHREINKKKTLNDNKRCEMPSKKVEVEGGDKKIRMQNSQSYEIHKRRESTEQTEISKQAKSQRPYCFCNSDCGLTLLGRDMDEEHKSCSVNYSYSNQSEVSLPHMKISNPPTPNSSSHLSKEKYEKTVYFPSQKTNGKEVKISDLKSLQMDRSCSSTEITAEKGFGNRKKAGKHTQITTNFLHVNRPTKVNTEDFVNNIREQQRSKKNSLTPLKFNYRDLRSYDNFQEQCSDEVQVLYECECAKEKAVTKYQTIYSSECENRKKPKLHSCLESTNKFFDMVK